ncbi:outer membrane usher protein [Luteibacter rhizovicinus]|uniref:Outer membrane usher protein n=1 Tax=Luteibacter rhizovicinus TaxID=242606 RepID=A0A4R3YJQ2_9GAMM|nr:fimbria/pilus outer membrane usher protein [Luteibacter rhizovicinus]TCV92312.1 outer membrane usher protein [Luteibacter rhizovicinus]
MLNAMALHATSRDAAEPAPPPPTVTPRTRTAGEDLYLEVILNGTSTSRLIHFVRHGEALCASTSDLRSLGFVALSGDDEQCLGDMKGVHYSYDVALQRVSVDASIDRLSLPRQVLNRNERTSIPATSSTGILLNYDIYASSGEGQGNISALAEARAFTSQYGVLSNTSLTRRYETNNDGWKSDSVRLDTQWRLALPDRAQALTIGDTFTGYLSWTRPTRIGGIAFGTDFALQPYRVTTPLPQFFGEATAPSAVELYVDGIKQYNGKVPAGPFQLTAVPGMDTAGQAQVVLTDALGRSSTVTFPIYSARQLLGAGVNDWSVELGAVREDYGITSFKYGHEPIVSATWRRGITNQFTFESHAEAGDGRGTAGAGAVWTPGGASVVNSSVSMAYGGGMQFGAGYTWTGKFMNLSLDTLRSRGNYRDVASGYGSAPPRVSDRALIGFNVRRASFGANLVRLRYANQPMTRYAGLFVFGNIGRGTSINLSINQNLDKSSDRSIFVGFTMALDTQRTLSFSAQRDRDRTSFIADASQPIPGDGGFGWHVQGRSGANGGGLGEVGWLGNNGQATLGASTMGAGSYSYADINGSVVFLGGHVFAARRVDDAFAVVTTDGVPDVPVQLENRRTGVTDSHGTLLVTRLNAYQDNRIAIDPLDLPADSRVQRVEAIVAPADRSGVVVRFPISQVRAASVVLVDEAGVDLPLGSRVDTGDGKPGIVGYDGLAYLDTLKGSTELRVTRTDGRTCTATLIYPEQAHDLPQLGPLTCREVRP